MKKKKDPFERSKRVKEKNREIVLDKRTRKKKTLTVEKGEFYILPASIFLEPNLGSLSFAVLGHLINNGATTEEGCSDTAESIARKFNCSVSSVFVSFRKFKELEIMEESETVGYVGRIRRLSEEFEDYGEMYDILTEEWD